MCKLRCTEFDHEGIEFSLFGWTQPNESKWRSKESLFQNLRDYIFIQIKASCQVALLSRFYDKNDDNEDSKRDIWGCNMFYYYVPSKTNGKGLLSTH